MIRSIARTVNKLPIFSIKQGLNFQQVQEVQSIRRGLTFQVSSPFAKISQKDKQKIKKQQQKKKIKQQIGDTSTFDLTPYQQKYTDIITAYKSTLQPMKVGRLEASFFSNIYIKIGSANQQLQHLAEIAPKNANTCVLNPYDQDNLEAIFKGLQTADLGLQVQKVDKTIVVTQLANTAKDLKAKMMEKVKKATEQSKDKIGKVRNEAKDALHKYEKVIPKERYRQIQKQVKALNEKFVAQLEKLHGQKQKQLA